MNTNQKPLLVWLVLACVVLFGAVIYLAGSGKPGSEPSAAPEEIAATSSSPSATPTPPKSTTTKKAPAPQVVSGNRMAISPLQGVVPLGVTFSLTLNSDRSCTYVNYVVDFGDGSSKEVSVPQNQCTRVYSTTLYHQYERAGTYAAKLSSKPELGHASVVFGASTVTTKDRVATTGNTKYGTFTTSPVSGPAPLKVAFGVSATDSSEVAGIYYIISFGDGQVALFPRTASPKLTHEYPSPGSYVVTVSRGTECAYGACAVTTPLGSINVTAN